MCGLVGIVSTDHVVQEIYDALTTLQHRGQDAAGIATQNGDSIELIKSNGLVKDVFQETQMLKLLGHMGIGHVRYPTAGTASSNEAQPLFTTKPKGFSLAHNGNLVNYKTLYQYITKDLGRKVLTKSDSELILNLLSDELEKIGDITDINKLLRASQEIHRHCSGGYAIVALFSGLGILAMRDPNGIRPLVLGERSTEGKKDYMVASESVSLTALGFNRIRDIKPGESLFITTSGELVSMESVKKRHTPCIFEFVYFARPDSMIDGRSVYKARLRMGDALGKKIIRENPNHDIDVVIPIPDTSRSAALQVAHQLNVKYREGFMKNRYIGRTFIMPGQRERRASVRRKLNPIELEFQNKNVLLVDDSIVRGTTSREIIKMARGAGANKVYFASAAPPVRFPNVYGIDMAVKSELVANNRTIEEVQEYIGADWLIYQDLEDLVDAVAYEISGVTEFDTSCFSGEYITNDVTEAYLDELEAQRSDAIRTLRDSITLQNELEIDAAS